MTLKVHSYNTWSFPSDIPAGTSDAGFARTMDAALETLANRDAVVIGERNYRANYIVPGWSRLNPTEIKAVNPSAKVYHVTPMCAKPMNDEDVKYYWREPSLMGFVLSREEIAANDWWLRDGCGGLVYECDADGNNLMDTIDGVATPAVWFMDVGKPGFRERYTEALIERLALQPDYDGVVLDYWWPTMISRWLTRYGRVAPAAYPDDAAWYSKAWQPFYTLVCETVRAEGYEIIGNCAGTQSQTDQWAVDQRACLDGVVYENFVFDFAKNGSGLLPASTVARRVAEIAAEPMTAWVCDAGLTELSSAADRETSLALYYVGATERTLYHHQASNMQPYRDGLWDIDLGEPTGLGAKRAGEFAWSRQYERGWVGVNCEAYPITFVLDSREYVDTDNRVVAGSVTVWPRSGRVLRLSQRLKRPTRRTSQPRG